MPNFNYYPFGMPMPGQTWESSTSDCQNVTQTALMPIHNYVEITALNSDFLSILGASLTTAPLAFKVTTTPVDQGFSYNIAPVVPNLAQQIKIYFHAPTPFILNYKVAQSGCSLPMNTIPPGTKNYTIYFTPCNLNAIQLLITAPSVFATTTIVIDSIVKDSISFTPELVITKVCDEGVYEYGYNGQLKDNEWCGNGNHNTALYWEYDTRNARRGNLDPKGNVWESPYAVFAGNPILNVDPLGDVVKTNEEGAKIILNGIQGVLTDKADHGVNLKANPFGFKDGKLTFDKNMDLSTYSPLQIEVIDKLKTLIDDNNTVTLEIINQSDKYIDINKDEKTLNTANQNHQGKANGATTPLTDFDKNDDLITTDQQCVIARNPITSDDKPERPELAYLNALHEVIGHAYQNKKHPPKSNKVKNENNVEVEKLMLKLFQNFYIEGTTWYSKRKPDPHEILPEPKE